MATDTERREVARRLRKAIGLTEFAEALGFNWTDDSDWGWKDVSDFVADLIEPSCDRDALLKLAEDMERAAGDREACPVLSFGAAVLIADYAYRIREALGVQDA